MSNKYLDIAMEKVIKQEVNAVIDKIRAEILDEKEYAYADFEQYKIDYLGVDAEYVEDELPQDDFRYGMERCVEIIDRYKADIRAEEIEHKCHNCKHYLQGEYDGSCGSYICKHYSAWELKYEM